MYTAEQLDDALGTTAQNKQIDQWRQVLSDQFARTTANRDAQMQSRLRQAEGMRQIRDQERYDALDLERRRRDAIESAIALTPTDTGRLSPRMLQALNADRGIEAKGGDVQDGQIVEGGWIGDSGDYGFVVARKGADGTLTPEPHRFSRADIYGMASNRPDLYEAAEVEKMGNDLYMADGAYVSRERLLGLTNKYKASRDKLDEDLNTARISLGGGGRSGGLTFFQKSQLEDQKQAGRMDLQKAKAESNLTVAKTQADAKKYAAEKRGSNPKEQVAALKGMLELARAAGMEDNEIFKTLDIPGHISSLEKGLSGGTSDGGGTEPPKSDNVSESEKKRIMESKVGTTFKLRGKKYVRTDDEVGFKPVQ